LSGRALDILEGTREQSKLPDFHILRILRSLRWRREKKERPRGKSDVADIRLLKKSERK
jgi:hypothetical protein